MADDADVKIWQSLRDDIARMLEGRDKKYSDVVKEYFKVHPKDEGKKKKLDDGEFNYVNCIERKYWKEPPKTDVQKETDFPEQKRIVAAIVFLKKLKKFLSQQTSGNPEQLLIRLRGLDFVSRFRMNVIGEVKKILEDRRYKPKKDADGKDEFDF